MVHFFKNLSFKTNEFGSAYFKLKLKFRRLQLKKNCFTVNTNFKN